MAKVLGVFDEHEVAKNAILAIKELGVSEEKISLVSKDDSEDRAEGDMMDGGQSLVNGTVAGGILGGAGALLASAGLLAIPGIGPILAAGPIVAGLTGAAAGGVLGGLIDYGIDDEDGERYAGEVENGRVLVGVEADDDNFANQISEKLKELGAYDVTIH